MKQDKHCYNDGIVMIYREAARETDFGAKRNVHILDNLNFVVKLDFAEQTRRQQDIEFAEQQGFSLSCKIKTRFIREVDSKCKCVIDGYLYDISFVDKTRTEMFLYLEGVGRIEHSEPDS